MDSNKQLNDFRNYNITTTSVIDTYKLNHANQTVDFVKQQLQKHCTNFDKIKLDIWTALDKLNTIIDQSDPDLNLPQIVHAFQTAEGLKKIYPNKDWLHLVGLIHDLGKIIAHPEIANQPQWTVVGDTFPVGCKFSDKIVFHEFFNKNPDYQHQIYSSKFGIYTPHCGLDNVLFSFGHDEYLYQVLIHNKCNIPPLGLKIIRYHSFYAWHKDNAYDYLMNDDDHEIKKWCKKFSELDLYTKNNNYVPNINALKNYYNVLINKYFPTTILYW